MYFHMGEVDGDVVIPVVEIFESRQDEKSDQDSHCDVIEIAFAFFVHGPHF
jgi:hypothetical protein